MCQTCRQQLQQSAADPSSWSDAEEFLPDQPFDGVSLSTHSLRFGDDHEEAKDRKASASVEVAQVLALLNPTDDPQMLGRIGGYEVSGVIGSGGMGSS